MEPSSLNGTGQTLGIQERPAEKGKKAAQGNKRKKAKVKKVDEDTSEDPLPIEACDEQSMKKRQKQFFKQI